MTDQYAVVGNPVAHSQSPTIHAEFARQAGHDLTYTAVLAPLDGFARAVREFRERGGRGINVTVPFKQEAWRLADRHEGCALEAGAVNTLEFENGRVTGHNTDGIGLVRDLRDNLRCTLRGKHVLLMGAGGAGYGVVEPLLREQPQSLVVANRTLDKAVAMVGHFEKFQSLAVEGMVASPYRGLAGRRFDVLINATSAGLANAMPPLPDGVFAPAALAYEMVYGTDTPFLCYARDQGARTADGIGMLVEQAAESFFIWRGVRPQTAPVIEMLRKRDS
jgi:shikimate dehydrogenase